MFTNCPEPLRKLPRALTQIAPNPYTPNPANPYKYWI
nr:MAG TPA: hypothetical protein [Caudoviricetes sp.]